MYDATKYRFDTNKMSHEAVIEDGAILYRLASIHFCDQSNILNGKAPLIAKTTGRFNAIHQPITYCANNILICIAEVLYHMYRQVLDSIQEGKSSGLIFNNMRWKKTLAIFKINRVDSLVYMDSEGIRLDYDSRLAGTTIVHPDPYYEPFRNFHEAARVDKEGLLYPSARHSKDICIALFGDKTDILQSDLFELLPVELKLVPEWQDPAQEPCDCDPFKEKLHATMGYYKFEDTNRFQSFRDNGVLYPNDIRPNGMVDFVRRCYLDYPRDAVLPRH